MYLGTDYHAGSHGTIRNKKLTTDFTVNVGLNKQAEPDTMPGQVGVQGSRFDDDMHWSYYTQPDHNSRYSDKNISVKVRHVTDEEAGVATAPVVHGDKLVLTAAPKPGYVFEGWYTDVSFTDCVSHDSIYTSDIISVFTDITSYYANFVPSSGRVSVTAQFTEDEKLFAQSIYWYNRAAVDYFD